MTQQIFAARRTIYFSHFQKKKLLSATPASQAQLFVSIQQC